MRSVDPSAPAWLWCTFASTAGLALVADASLSHRVNTFRCALIRVVSWTVLGLAFACVVAVGLGPAASAEYLSAFLIEETLSLDNLAAFLMIFRELNISGAAQHRVLMAGVVGAVVGRGALIATGVRLLEQWHALAFVLAALLVAAAGRTLYADETAGQGRALRALRRVGFVSWNPEGHFFVRKDGHRLGTTMVAAVLAVELVDLMFAVDSISSAFAISSRVFVLYSSNVFAVLGLRSLLAIIAQGLSKVRFLKHGIAALLVFAALKLALSDWIVVPPLATATIVLTLIAVLGLVSAFGRRSTSAD